MSCPEFGNEKFITTQRQRREFARRLTVPGMKRIIIKFEAQASVEISGKITGSLTAFTDDVLDVETGVDYFLECIEYEQNDQIDDIVYHELQSGEGDFDEVSIDTYTRLDFIVDNHLPSNTETNNQLSLLSIDNNKNT